MKITPRRARVIGLLGSWLIRCLGRTWRVRCHNQPDPLPNAVYLLWHGRMLLPAMRFRRANAVIMISRHGDGELIAQAIERLGYATVRGSSSRGASRAALELLRTHGDRPWLLTPDGPRGPHGSVKDGALQLAAGAGRTIIPLGCAARRFWRLRSWDGFTIPKPFTRVECVFGDPIEVPSELTREDLSSQTEDVRERLEAVNLDAQRRADPSGS